MKLTTTEIAARLCTSRETAYKLVSFMKDMQIITVVGNRPNPLNRGKGAEEYKFSVDCGTQLVALIAKLLGP